MRFFLPRRMAPSKCPATVFLRTNEITFSLKMKNRYFPVPSFFCELEMPGDAEKPFSLKMKNRYFPRRNRPFLRFSGRNRTYSDAFFPPASNGTIEMPGERVFLRTNAEKPFSLKMKNPPFPAFFGPEPDLFRCVFSSRVEWHHRNARRTRFSAN